MTILRTVEDDPLIRTNGFFASCPTRRLTHTPEYPLDVPAPPALARTKAFSSEGLMDNVQPAASGCDLALRVIHAIGNSMVNSATTHMGCFIVILRLSWGNVGSHRHSSERLRRQTNHKGRALANFPLLTSGFALL